MAASDLPYSSSPKYKSSIFCFSCCFGGRQQISSDSERPKLLDRSSSWVRSKSQRLPELRVKCRNLISRIGKSKVSRPRNYGEFRYDPLSYALNFDDGPDDTQIEEDSGFSSGFPRSPVRHDRNGGDIAIVSREIACL